MSGDDFHVWSTVYTNMVWSTVYTKNDQLTSAHIASYA